MNKDLKVITPKVFEDDRGYFFESFNEFKYNLNVKFVQDNESKSSKGVIRGLHYQIDPYAQSKLVRVIKGAVIDFVLDIRTNSPNYGQLDFILLDEFNKNQFFIPRGFAHGFISLIDETIFSYKCDNYYNKESERGFNLFSDSLNLIEKLKSFINENNISYEFPKELVISQKDKNHPNFNI